MINWALFILLSASSTADTGEPSLKRIESFETRYSCEIMRDLFVQKFGPMKEGDKIACLRVDQ